MAPKASTKPLFVPLKSEYFEGFKQGSKTTEFRPYGDRWNRDTVWVGRKVTLAHGYGWPRLHGVVTKIQVSTAPSASKAWRACYGPGVRDVMCITCKVTELELEHGHQRVKHSPGVLPPVKATVATTLNQAIKENDILVDTMRRYGTVYKVRDKLNNGDLRIERYNGTAHGWELDGTYQPASMTGYAVYRQLGSI